MIATIKKTITFFIAIFFFAGLFIFFKLPRWTDINSYFDIIHENDIIIMNVVTLKYPGNNNYFHNQFWSWHDYNVIIDFLPNDKSRCNINNEFDNIRIRQIDVNLDEFFQDFNPYRQYYNVIHFGNSLNTHLIFAFIDDNYLISSFSSNGIQYEPILFEIHEESRHLINQLFSTDIFHCQ